LEGWRVTPEELNRLVAVCHPGIAGAVRILREAGVETFQSCQGAEGHTTSEPLIQFGCGLPVLYLRLQWNIEHGHEPVGPYWEIVFREQVPC
jgi:hypothetical protein